MTRLPCCVPHCRRTRGDRKGDPVSRYSEWICGDHYKLVDKELKLRRRQLRRRHGDTPRGRWADDVMWAKIRKQAIERGLGIS